MANTLGILSKAAFRLEGGSISGAGLVNSDYPTTPTEADSEEVALDGYDMIPYTSEGINETYTFELDETLAGPAAVINMDNVSIEGDGPVEVQGMYDGIDALIAAAMGFEKGGAADSPDSVNPTALTGGTMATGTWVDSGTPFAAGDVGKFIRVTSGTGEGQVRRISAYNSTSSVDVTPNWDVTPSAADTAEMELEFLHLYELSNRMNDELWTDAWSSYPTGGVGTANDQLIRRGTFGVKKHATTPWIFRSAMINAMTITASQKSGLNFSFDMLPFDLDRASGTNGAASADDWDFNESANMGLGLNERILFNHLNGNGFFRIGTYAGGAMDSTDEYGISELSVTLNNNLKADDQDSISTPYRIEPTRGGFREVTGSITLPRYSADTFFTWRENKTILQIHARFAGSTMSSNQRWLEIFVGSLILTEGSANIAGPAAVPQTFGFRAIVPAGNPTFVSSGNPTQIITAPRSELMLRTRNYMPFNMFRDQNKEY